MEYILFKTLSNTITVAALVLFAILMAKVVKNKKAIAIIWIIVLLKLITPTIVHLPIVNIMEEYKPAKTQNQSDYLPRHDNNIAETQKIEIANDIYLPITSKAETAFSSLGWPMTIGLIWGTGSILFFSYNLCYIAYISVLLRKAHKPPHFVTQQAKVIAEKLFLKSPPNILMLDRPVSPCVWEFTLKPIIVMPTRLFFSLDRNDQELIITHEMTHIKRHDNIVRFIEFIALTIHWWNPLAWLICFKVRQSSEMCCDISVLNTHPQKTKDYARVLVQTVEYLSNRPTFAFSSGLTREPFINRRIKMLTNNKNESFSLQSRLLIILLVLTIPFSIGTTYANEFEFNEIKERVLHSLENQDEHISESVERVFEEYEEEMERHNEFEEHMSILAGNIVEMIGEESLASVNEDQVRDFLETLEHHIWETKEAINHENEIEERGMHNHNHENGWDKDDIENTDVKRFKVGNATITITTNSGPGDIHRFNLGEFDGNENLAEEINRQIHEYLQNMPKFGDLKGNFNFDDFNFDPEIHKELIKKFEIEFKELKEMAKNNHLHENFIKEKENIIEELHNKMEVMEERYHELKEKLHERTKK